MKIQNLNDQELLQTTELKAQEEREATLAVIELLTEIQKRRLHLKRGFASLHEYCVKELRYSDGAAFRRIKAMLLVESVPEAAVAIESGALSLTSASCLQRAFEARAKTKEDLTKEARRGLVERLLNQSTREVEKVVAEVAPEAFGPLERVKPVGKDLMKIEFIVEEQVFQNIEKLKSLTSHKNKNFRDLIVSLVMDDLKRRDPELKKRASAPTGSRVKNSRYIPSAVKHHVWMRDKGRCSFIDPLTKHQCESKHKLQFEHIQAFALGGNNAAENICLLCREHNNLRAINQFGEEKMSRYTGN